LLIQLGLVLRAEAVDLMATGEAVGSEREDREDTKLLFIHFCSRHTKYIHNPEGILV